MISSMLHDIRPAFNLCQRSCPFDNAHIGIVWLLLFYCAREELFSFILFPSKCCVCDCTAVRAVLAVLQNSQSLQVLVARCGSAASQTRLSRPCCRPLKNWRSRPILRVFLSYKAKLLIDYCNQSSTDSRRLRWFSNDINDGVYLSCQWILNSYLFPFSLGKTAIYQHKCLFFSSTDPSTTVLRRTAAITVSRASSWRHFAVHRMQFTLVGSVWNASCVS